MRYISTRGQAPPVSFLDAVLAGMAPDGGLYVPESCLNFEGDVERGNCANMSFCVPVVCSEAFGGGEASTKRAYDADFGAPPAPLRVSDACCAARPIGVANGCLSFSTVLRSLKDIAM